MSRQPIQVHIFLYRKAGEAYEYAIFQRSDMPECWQGVCGGLEGTETLVAGAKREVFEEAGIFGDFPLYQLESISYLPDEIFSPRARAVWGSEVVVVPMYFFAMPFDGEIKLSHEHTAVEWLSYDAAYDRIYYMDQKIALYELHQRLLRGLLSA